jgi:hypothetical protein
MAGDVASAQRALATVLIFSLWRPAVTQLDLSSSPVELGGTNSTYFNVAGLDADTAIACYTVMEASGLRCRVFQADGTMGDELDISASGDVKAIRVVPMGSAGSETGALLCHEAGTDLDSAIHCQCLSTAGSALSSGVQEQRAAGKAGAHAQ